MKIRKMKMKKSKIKESEIKNKKNVKNKVSIDYLFKILFYLGWM